MYVWQAILRQWQWFHHRSVSDAAVCIYVDLDVYLLMNCKYALYDTLYYFALMHDFVSLLS